MIGGSTIFADITTEWTSVNTYAQRTTNLTTGVGGTALTAATIQNDGVKDTLNGGKKSEDWYISSTGDKLTGFEAGETGTTI